MEKKAYLFLLSLFMFTTVIIAQGNLKGKVLDNSKLSLPGATVYIKSILKGSYTDIDGKFSIVNIPSGTYTIDISYVGYKDVKKEVTIKDGETTTIDIILDDTETLSEVIIKGSAGADLKAMNRQKTARTIVNVISSDQVGRFPDPNIGDALKRIPGIYVQYDQGEANLVSLRGTDPSKTLININGTAIPGTGDSRAVGVDAIPADMVQAIEVSKALTPDMDGDAIGGSINLITRSAPYTRRLSVTLGNGYNMLTHKTLPNGNIIYGDRFFDKKLGIIGSASVYNQKLGSNAHSSPWETSNIGSKEYFIPRYLNLEQTLMQRLRQSYTVGIDYQFNDNHSVKFSGIFNDYKDWRQRFTLKVDDIGDGYKNENWKRASGFEGYEVFDDKEDYEEELNDGNTEIVLDENNDGVDDNTGKTYLDFDPNNPTFYPELERHIHGGKNNKNAELRHKRIFNYGLEGDHLIGKLKLDWTASYIKSIEDQPDRREIEFESENEKTVVMDYRNPRKVLANNGFELVVNQSDFEGKTSDELRKIDTWYLDGFKGYNDRSNVGQYLGAINFELPISEGKYENKIKFGGKIRGMDKERLRLAKNKWYPTIDGSGTYNWKWFWKEIFNNRYDAGKELFGNSPVNVGSSISPEWVSHQNQTYNKDNADWQVKSSYADAQSDNYTAEEKVTAGYLMTTQKMGEKLTIIGGFRIEKTNLQYEGQNFLGRANTYGDKVKSNSDFTNLLPSLHFRYAPNKKAVLRAAYTRTISRPSYKDIVPFRKVDVKYKEMKEGNPNIKPTLSNNFDLLGEYYTGSRGLISGGIYYKNVKDFRIDQIDVIPWNEVEKYVPTPEELLSRGVEQDAVDYYNKYYKKAKDKDFERTIPTNGGNADLIGVEIAFQKELSFLPGILKHLTVYSNYTHNWLLENKDENTLPGTASDIINFSLAYQAKKLNIRASYNYTSSFLNSTGRTEQKNIYYDSVNYLDANMDFFVTPKFIIFASMNNILNQEQRRYQWRKEYTYSNLVNGTRLQLGVKYNL